MTNFSHLDAIQNRIRNEQARLDYASAARRIASGKRDIAALDNEIAFREREIASAKREEAAEYKFLGIEPAPATLDELLSDDDLLRELGI